LLAERRTDGVALVRGWPTSSTVTARRVWTIPAHAFPSIHR